jgi:hypothetical protein
MKVSEEARRSLWSSAAVLVVGALALISFILMAARIDTAPSRQHLIEAFESGALGPDATRTLEIVPGFVVAPSDQFSSCVPLSLSQAAPGDVFGSGPFSGPYSCEGVYVGLQGGAGTISYGRYWNGSSAVLKVLLTFTSVLVVQVGLTITLTLLLGVLAWRAWRFSQSMGVGVFVTLAFASDILWHGMSVSIGVTSAVGLAGVIATQVAFERRWAGRWGVVLLSGLCYACLAQMYVPIAFAILTGIAAGLPLLRRTQEPIRSLSTRASVIGIVAVLWVAGYVLGLATRYAWIVVFGPGLSSLQGEVGSSSTIFMSHTFIQPFHGLVTLLMRTWFEYGWMQVGLMAVVGVIGWGLARGGSVGFKSRPVFISLAPLLLGFAWLAAWGGHTQHLFVNLLLAAMLLNVVFAVEFGRRVAWNESRISTDPQGVGEKLDQDDEGVEPVAHAALPVD